MPAIRTASELGLAIRSRRRELKLDQAELARRVGVTRQWVIDIEKGKPRAELELVMRALHALELRSVLNRTEARALLAGMKFLEATDSGRLDLPGPPEERAGPTAGNRRSARLGSDHRNPRRSG